VPLPDSQATRVTAAHRMRRVVWGLLILVLGSTIALGIWRHALELGSSDGLPIYGTVPTFSLLERSGKPVRAEDMRGGVWVADFIFTRCAGTCPILSTALAALLRRLDEAGLASVRAVSFSVDPTHDDPVTLTRYAERFAADPTRWLFVTGDAMAIARLVREGFKLGVTDSPADGGAIPQEPITHSDRFVLIDSQLRIRGYYHGTDAEGVADLERDLFRLAGRRQ